MKIAIINGPNLNLIGIREPELYGHVDFPSFFSELKSKYPSVELHLFQSNVEGELVGRLQEWGFSFDGIILNAAAYSHTSLAIADAVSAIKTPVVEVHITNIFAREDYRHVSFSGARCVGSVSGFGMAGYEMALHYFMNMHARR
jgi:3-dehydroquinate dehydratase-2